MSKLVLKPHFSFTTERDAHIKQKLKKTLYILVETGKIYWRGREKNNLYSLLPRRTLYAKQFKDKAFCLKTRRGRPR